MSTQKIMKFAKETAGFALKLALATALINQAVKILPDNPVSRSIQG